jgi:trehalose 6-phosphate synthase/phosphatase
LTNSIDELEAAGLRCKEGGESFMQLLMVSNRLPVTVSDEREFEFKESVGGLVSGLKAYLDLKSPQLGDLAGEYTWIGWPGATVKEHMKKNLISRMLSDFHGYPVFLTEKAMDRFYHGFCNRTIWPLFHYFTSNVSYDNENWSYYRKVNENFCDSVMQILRPDDVVWVHDYHLMLLPGLIRERMPDVSIGFFLHIPFPTFEVFRLLPSKWRKDLLEGLLGADLIGFHTHDYTQHFLRCALRILGHEHSMGQIQLNDHLVRVETYPMGIDFQKFYSAVSRPEVQAERAELRNVFPDCRVILSLDRLDYTKGIVNRLQGYELFLEKNPEWQGKAVMVLIVVPSRSKVEHYQQMKRQIDEVVGRINGKFGSINWTPILYHYKFLPFNKLVALYNSSDVALVTPIRDGMNLVAKEYLATKREGKGVLIISEMAGASKEVREAIIINPNDLEEIAGALKDALEMPEEEQMRRNRIMQSRLRRHDVVRWADSFVRALQEIKDEERGLHHKQLSASTRAQLLDDFKRAEHRLLLLDYDGTLVQFAGSFDLAKTRNESWKTLRMISKDPKNEVVLLSGSDKMTLQSLFGTLDIGLVAEHGAWIKKRNKDWRMPKPLTNDWKPKILPILEMYSDRLPGSYVEDKEFSLAWHYRMADHEMASAIAKELLDDLVSFTANIAVQVLQGNRVIEVRNTGMSKGDAGSCWLSEDHFDFILGVGDDWADGEFFKILPETAHSIKVGSPQSAAKFNLRDPKEVLKLLQELGEESFGAIAQISLHSASSGMPF